jgi:hypothetical protein
MPPGSKSPITPDEFSVLLAALRDVASDYKGIAQTAANKFKTQDAQAATNIYVFCQHVERELASGKRQLNQLQLNAVTFALVTSKTKYAALGDAAMVSGDTAAAQRDHNFAWWCGQVSAKVSALVKDRPGLLVPLG